MTTLSTRQIGQRIRRGMLPDYSDGGMVFCAICGADLHGNTEALSFWSKGDTVYCTPCSDWQPALARFPSLDIQIDTRL